MILRLFPAGYLPSPSMRGGGAFMHSASSLLNEPI